MEANKDLKQSLLSVVDSHSNVYDNIPRKEMIEESVVNGEAIISESGALATWTPTESTGRSPKDTVIVKRAASEANIDWSSPNNIPITEETFNIAYEEALGMMSETEKIYVTDRVVGADTSYALPVKVVSSEALSVLFTDNMFRPVPEGLENSVFAGNGYTILHLPYNKLNPDNYDGRLRKMPNGDTSNMIVAMDMDRRQD